VAAIIKANLPSRIQSHIITLADGGEGSLDLISKKVKGNWITCDVQDPLMRSIKACYYVSS
jgi:glycerate kinase